MRDKGALLHATLSATQVYAEHDLAKALQIVAEIG
jgi:hypothetical protein